MIYIFKNKEDNGDTAKILVYSGSNEATLEYCGQLIVNSKVFQEFTEDVKDVKNIIIKRG